MVNKLLKVATPFVLLLLSALASAQVIDSRRLDITLKYLLENRSKTGMNLLSSTTPDPCMNGSCNSVLTVTEIQQSGVPVSCLVTANNIDLTDPGTGKGHKTTITWTFTVKDVGGAPAKASYAFPSYNGIAIVEDETSDHKHQTSGKGEPDSATRATLYHTYNKKHDSVSFFPIILQTTTNGSTPLMCAATDPKIVNE